MSCWRARVRVTEHYTAWPLVEAATEAEATAKALVLGRELGQEPNFRVTVVSVVREPLPPLVPVVPAAPKPHYRMDAPV